MRILIISDTHGKVDTMLEVLKKEPHDIAIHAGDYDNIEVWDPSFSDIKYYEIEKELINKNFKYHIRGNHGICIDLFKANKKPSVNELVKALMSDYLPFELEGKRFLLMHLHYLNDKDIPESNEYTIKFTKDLEEKYKPDYIISGHTHVAKIAMHGDIPVINPGSLNKPRYPQTSGSYIVATLDNGELTYQIKYL